MSYKLNGVPKNADELAGASGLIEIHIDAKFNDSAEVNEYYKNNFVLAVAVMLDTNECYSLEADGAQKQTIGSNSALCSRHFRARMATSPSALARTALRPAVYS